MREKKTRKQENKNTRKEKRLSAANEEARIGAVSSYITKQSKEQRLAKREHNRSKKIQERNWKKIMITANQ